MSNIPIKDLAAAAECVQVRNQIRIFSIGLAGVVAALAVPLFGIFWLMECWDNSLSFALVIVLAVWSTAFLVYIRPHPVLGFLFAGICLLFAAFGIFCFLLGAGLGDQILQTKLPTDSFRAYLQWQTRRPQTSDTPFADSIDPTSSVTT